MIRPDDDPAAVARAADLLRAVRAGHEPDRARIVARMGFDPADGMARPSLSRRAPARLRPGVAVLRTAPAMAAAALVAALVVTAAVASIPHGRPSVGVDGGATATPAPTASPITSPAALPTTLPDTAPGPVAPPGRPSTGAGPRSATGSVTAAPQAPLAPSSDPQVTPVTAGYGVTLGAGSDWLAIGARADGTTVRTKRPVIGGLTLSASGAAPGRPGPYRVSWSGGAPEQDHAAATGWLAIGADGHADVTLPPTSRVTTLRLYLGAEGADAVVSGAANAVLRGPGAGRAAAVVTVSLPPLTETRVVTVFARVRAAGGYAGLAAAQLS